MNQRGDLPQMDDILRFFLKKKLTYIYLLSNMMNIWIVKFL